MKRELTLREKILLLVLVVMVIVLGYFKLILEPINDQVEQYNSQTLQEQLLVDQQQIKLAQMKKMEKLLEAMKENGEYRQIPSFDNRTNVIVELHSVLASAASYSLTFQDTVQKDYIVSRPVSMSFTAKDYPTARQIIQKLHDSDNFNLISDVSIQMDAKYGTVTVSMQITYYEVMN